MSMKQEKNSLEEYLELNYPITIHEDPEEGFVAEIEDLPGCVTQADTLVEVYEAIQDARLAWITATYESGQDIPLPIQMEEYKGKILVRLPRYIHKQLVQTAKRQGVSLNQYMTDLLVAGVHGDLLSEQVIKLREELLPATGLRWWSFPIFGSNDEVIRGIDIDKLKLEEVTGR